jgi:hypothetical protein
MAPGPADSPSSTAYDTGLSLIQYTLVETDLVDVELVFYGPRNKVRGFTEQIAYPSGVQFAPSAGKSLGPMLKNHLAANWRSVRVLAIGIILTGGRINQSHTRDVGRPNCRERIRGARRRHPKQCCSWRNWYNRTYQEVTQLALWRYSQHYQESSKHHDIPRSVSSSDLYWINANENIYFFTGFLCLVL